MFVAFIHRKQTEISFLTHWMKVFRLLTSEQTLQNEQKWHNKKCLKTIFYFNFIKQNTFHIKHTIEALAEH